MCLLIYKPENKTIPFEHIQQGMESNSDGAGFALQLPDRNSVWISKGLWTAEDFQKELDLALQYFGGNPAATVHFRWSTGGKVNALNCHPFTLDRVPLTRGYTTQALAHNGVLSRVNACDKFSDTYHLAQILARKWSKRAIKKELHNHVGPSNKFVLMTPNKAHIIGEQYGHWLDGIWYSNHSYAQPRYTTFRFPNYGKFSPYTEDWDCLEDINADDCLYCDKPTARYRLGGTDAMLCWDCKKVYLEDTKDLPTAGSDDAEFCSFCESMVSIDTPHYCIRKVHTYQTSL